MSTAVETEKAVEQHGAKPSSAPFSDPEKAREAARLSAESRRAKRTAREAAAELDKLTVEARFAVALARKLSYVELEAVIEALAGEAKKGKTQAAKILLDYVRVLRGTDDDQAEDMTKLEDMSPAQRAVTKSRIVAELEALEAQDAATEDIP